LQQLPFNTDRDSHYGPGQQPRRTSNSIVSDNSSHSDIRAARAINHKPHSYGEEARIVASSANRERGATMIEFLFAGVPLILLLLIIFELCLAMWSYHTLATAVEDGAIYASTKGQDCTYTGNSCRVTISAIVQDILSTGIGINPNQLKLTFHSSASTYYADITCNPASSCLTGSYTTTYWPPALVSSGPPAVYGNMPDINYIDITGTCPAPVPVISLLWQWRSLAGIGSLQFSAMSRQIIQF